MVRQSDLTITLVHGTWGRGAFLKSQKAHFTSASLLRRTLAERFPAALIDDKFVWSGLNSTKARLSGALALQAHLANLIRKRPSACQVVVCHSHGGSVALHALKDEFLRRRVAGIVTLSTPFLHAHRRALTEVENAIVTESLAAPVLALVVVGLAPLVRMPTTLLEFTELTDPNRMNWVAPMLLLAAVVTALAVARRLTNGVAKLTRRVAEERLSEHQYPSLAKESLLIVRGAGDEPSAWLGLTRALEWLVERILAALSLLARAATRLAGAKHPSALPAVVLGGLVACVLAGALLRLLTWVLTLIVVSPEGMWPIMIKMVTLINAVSTSLVLYPAAVGLLTYVALLAIIATTAILQGVLFLPLTGSIDLASLFVRVSAEPVPPGTWLLTQGSVGYRGLQHATYEDEAVVDEVIQWIASRLALASS